MEQILVNALGMEAIPELAPVEMSPEQYLFFVDDSAIARKEIMMTLDKLSVPYQQANNGHEAWEKLQNLAARAQHDGIPVRNLISVILTDAEMPEMDGYVLTRKSRATAVLKASPLSCTLRFLPMPTAAWGKQWVWTLMWQNLIRQSWQRHYGLY